MEMMSKFVHFANDIIANVCQILAIFVIAIGIVKAVVIFTKDALFGQNSASAIQESRLELGHSFSLGLGFLIGASILKTTLAPSWNDIGQLASIIAIRTVLNYFLLKEIKDNAAEQVKIPKSVNQLKINENGTAAEKTVEE